MSNWSKFEKQYIIENYNKVSKEIILKNLPDRKWSAIMQMAIKLKLTKTKPQKIWTQEEDSRIIELYPTFSIKEMSKIFDRSEDSIKSRAKKLMVQRPSQNHNKLKKLLDKSNESMYWLGFIMADGHISKKGQLSITLNIKDYDYLNKLCKYLNLELKTKSGEICFDNYKQGDVCYFTCQDALYGLKILDIFKISEAKTYNPISLEYIESNDEFLSFLAGLIDGDGCFCKTNKDKLSFIRIQCHASWKSVYDEVVEKLSKIGIDSRCFYDTQGYIKFIISKQKNMINFNNLIYKLNLPLMKRKWNLFETIKNS